MDGIIFCFLLIVKGKILYSNGDTYEGMFNCGHMEGEGILKCTNGMEYNGEWKASLVNVFNYMSYYTR